MKRRSNVAKYENLPLHIIPKCDKYGTLYNRNFQEKCSTIMLRENVTPLLTKI